MRYMNKAETTAHLLIENGVDPAFTETVWEELERQNQEFFKAYKVKLMVMAQIAKFNELLVSQRNAMMENLQNEVTSISLPSGDPTIGMSHPLSENQGAHDVNNGACHAPTMDISARTYNEMTGASVQNGFVPAPVINTTSRMQHGMNGGFFHNNAEMHQLMNGVIPNNGVVHVPETSASNGMLNELNGAGIYSQAANFAFCSSDPFQQAMNTPFEIRMPHCDPYIYDQKLFPFSDHTLLDMIERTGLPPEASSFSFSQPITMDVVDGILDGDFSERMMNGSSSGFKDKQFCE